MVGRTNLSKYWGIYHDGHWLRRHLRFDCSVRRSLNQNRFLEIASNIFHCMPDD